MFCQKRNKGFYVKITQIKAGNYLQISNFDFAKEYKLKILMKIITILIWNLYLNFSNNWLTLKLNKLQIKQIY